MKNVLGNRLEASVAAFDTPNGTPTQVLAKELRTYLDSNSSGIIASRITNEVVIDTVNAKTLVKMLSSADNVVPSAVSALTIENIRKLNESGNILDIAVGRNRANVPFSDALDNLLTSGNLGPEEVKILQKGLDSRSSLVTQEQYIESFIKKLDDAITSGKKSMKDPDGVVIDLNQKFIDDFKVFKKIESEAVEKMVKDTFDQLKQVREQIASGVSYKELPPFAKKVIDDAVAISTESVSLAKDKSEKEIYRLEKLLKEVGADDSTTKNRIKEQITLEKVKSVSIQKEIDSIKKQAVGDELRKIAIGNLDDAIKNRSAAIEAAARDISQKGVRKTMADGFMSVVLSSPDTGVVDPKNYRVLSKTYQDSRRMLYSPDPNANFKGMVKSFGVLYSLYQAYNTVSSVVGESVTEYRLRLGAQKATDSLVTLFMIYKGEPYLSNLEGLTRYKSKAITSDTSYWEYLKSRFYNFSEIGEFVAGSFGNIVGSSLSQYTDILQNSQIDTGLYSSIPSDIKFGSSSDNSGSSGITVDIDGPTVSANPLGSFETSNVLSGYGWRGLAVASFHSGIDVTNPGTHGPVLAPHSIDQLVAKNKVVAIETGIALSGNNKTIGYAAYIDALSKGHSKNGAAPWNAATDNRIGLFGLSSGILWVFQHVMPSINSATISAQAVEASLRAQLVQVKSVIGFIGPFGSAAGEHIHLETYKAETAEAKALMSQMKEAYKNNNLESFISSNNEKLKEIIKISYRYSDRNPLSPKHFGFVRVDPESVITNPNMNLGGKVKFLYKDRKYGQHGQPLLTDQQRLDNTAAGQGVASTILASVIAARKSK
jgi:hypothetical protein